MKVNKNDRNAIISLADSVMGNDCLPDVPIYYTEDDIPVKREFTDVDYRRLNEQAQRLAISSKLLIMDIEELENTKEKTCVE